MERADFEQWKAREVARLLGLVETQRRYYEEIAAAIPVGLLIISQGLDILSANRAIRKIFDLSQSPLKTRVDALLPVWVLDRVKEVIKTGAPQTNIFVTDARQNRRLRIGVVAIRSWDDESSPEALVSIEDLAGVEGPGVPVPTGIAGDVLRESHVQSERVQAVSKLAARLAHDLNNILMIVTGHSEELTSSLPPDSPLGADLQEIVNATNRMSSLTGNLLNFTRRQTTALETFALDEFLRGLARRLDVKFSPASQSQAVKADPQRLDEILTSFVEHERPVAIQSAATATHAAIEITMTGRPFEPVTKNNWFETVLPGKDTKDDLLLSVTRAYGIVRQWGGDITVSAAPAGGTLLRILLESDNKASANAAAENGLATILVVDDESGIRELIQKILRRHGYHVLEASNGEEALTIWREHSGGIDLVITDVMMPRMGGPELVDRIRKQGGNPRVLYISGYTDDPDIYSGKFPPGTAFLPKPFTLKSLLDRVREVLT